MALLARGREAAVVHRGLGVVVIRLVAGDARGGRNAEVTVDVTQGARGGEVRAGQRPTRRSVIEFSIGPNDGVMTLLARRGETGMRHRRRRGVVGRLVAGDAGRDRDVVVVIDVATGARRRQVRACQREARRRVVKRRVGPQHGVMALLARQREARVIDRRLGVVVSRLVARYAGCGGDVVVVIDMARGTGRCEVRAGQGKAGGRVIKLGIGPQHGVMALFAGCRETGMRNWRGRVVVVRLVARDASRDRDVVVVVDMAAGTGSRQVRSDQRPSRGRVVKLSICPQDRVMALFTGRWETGVAYRGRRVVVIRLMARNAGRDRNLIVVVDMATSARRRDVRTGERET